MMTAPWLNNQHNYRQCRWYQTDQTTGYNSAYTIYKMIHNSCIKHSRILHVIRTCPDNNHTSIQMGIHYCITVYNRMCIHHTFHSLHHFLHPVHESVLLANSGERTGFCHVYTHQKYSGNWSERHTTPSRGLHWPPHWTTAGFFAWHWRQLEDARTDWSSCSMQVICGLYLPVLGRFYLQGLPRLPSFCFGMPETAWYRCFQLAGSNYSFRDLTALL